MDFSQTSLELALAATGDTFLGPGHILAVGSGTEVFSDDPWSRKERMRSDIFQSQYSTVVMYL